ncbi:aminoglycoside phosphotransferase family protein [Hyalangium sp.]|uniref:phosphotransferase family protein n=1 Tax=Hyalangium sp. TaxID=2028555 RepID=UPI002D60EA77|nr:aminoglycoside phosphotransferase family protein [Hyalangium sp.]HYI01996.1 aminoglycoside phosphotransferase family protein [Hyalangium sp.]
MPTSPADPYATLAQRLGGRLTRRWTLHGGVSAKVQALELILPDGTTARVVVRQHGAASWKPLEEGVTSTELEALRHLLEQREAGQEPRLTGSVLHGDFWPGNILWQEDRIAAVIDWEDAAVGDPLSDLACSRVELMCAYGEAAMEAFTAHFLDRAAATLSRTLN